MRGKFVFSKTVTTSAGVVIALVTLMWIVWQASSSHHRAEIESLQQTLKTVTASYNVLAAKSDGLLEPRLI